MKKPGRPSIDPTDKSVPVTVTLPAKKYEEYTRRALREDVSVPEIIRRQLLYKFEK